MSDISEEEFNGEMEEEEEEEEEEQQEEDDDDDDNQASSDDLKRSAKKNTSYAEADSEDDDDDDSEDDIPLAALAAKAKKKDTKKPPAASKNGSKKAPAKKATPKKPPPPAKKTSSVSSDKTYEFASAALYQSDSLKGLLIQRLLCRWWYAYQWPDPTTLPAKPPKNYDTLDGFPGVYVCTQGEKVGNLLDLRDKDHCPSFRNFANKPSLELQDLLLKALKNQKEQLVEHEGAGTSLEKELNILIKWATKLDPKKADKEAIKVLKASKLKL